MDDDGLAWLYGRQGFGIKLGLANMEALLRRLGNPERNFKSIHVAGTNGKGTVTCLLADMLRRSGHRVGATISPHLEHFGERIQIDGEAASAETVRGLIAHVRPHVDVMDAAGTHPTFFEITTAMAFHHFSSQGIEWACVETGLGGRLDATNVVAPEVTIITTIAEDHQDVLGNTLAEIATEKAGIMKLRVPCITAVHGPALAVLKARTYALEVPLATLGEDFHVVPEINGLRLLSGATERHFDVSLVGQHQLRNAALAVMAADTLRAAGHVLPPLAVAESLRQFTMPARLETIHHEGMHVLIDGAHNEDAAVVLRAHLAVLDWAGFHLIVGFQADKKWRLILQQWSPLAAKVWGVPLNSSRSLDPPLMAAEIDVIPFAAARSFAEALEGARQAGAETVLVAGSLWLAGEARAHLLGNQADTVLRDQ